jgi:hypothetical protein
VPALRDEVGAVPQNCAADTTNSKSISIVFFSARNEIFSIGMKLYVGIRPEKLKCQKDFLHARLEK